MNWSGDIQPYIIGAFIALMILFSVNWWITWLLNWFDDRRVDCEVKRMFADVAKERKKITPAQCMKFDRAKDRGLVGSDKP